MQKAASLVPLKNIFLQDNASDLFPLNPHPKPLSKLPPSASATWAEAEGLVRAMAALVPERGRDKTYLHVERADGERYGGRIEITRPMSAAPAPLSAHVRRALEFIAGRWRPASEQERAFLAEGEQPGPGRAAWAAKILNGYALGGAP